MGLSGRTKANLRMLILPVPFFHQEAVLLMQIAPSDFDLLLPRISPL